MMTLSTAQQSLILAMFAMVLLTALVAFRMLYMRVQEMKRERIHPGHRSVVYQKSDPKRCPCL